MGQYNGRVVKRAEPEACRAWQLLMKFYFVQRRHLPGWAAELGLSQVQCHVLHLIEPGRPVPMSRLAEVLSCDASNVTGLVDRLEARGLLARRPSPGDRRVKVLALTPPGIAPARRDAAPHDRRSRCRCRRSRRTSGARWWGCWSGWSATRSARTPTPA